MCDAKQPHPASTDVHEGLRLRLRSASKELTNAGRFGIGLSQNRACRFGDLLGEAATALASLDAGDSTSGVALPANSPQTPAPVEGEPKRIAFACEKCGSAFCPPNECAVGGGGDGRPDDLTYEKVSGSLPLQPVAIGCFVGGKGGRHVEFEREAVRIDGEIVQVPEGFRRRAVRFWSVPVDREALIERAATLIAERFGGWTAPDHVDEDEPSGWESEETRRREIDWARALVGELFGLSGVVSSGEPSEAMKAAGAAALTKGGPTAQRPVGDVLHDHDWTPREAAEAVLAAAFRVDALPEREDGGRRTVTVQDASGHTLEMDGEQVGRALGEARAGARAQSMMAGAGDREIKRLTAAVFALEKSLAEARAAVPLSTETLRNPPHDAVTDAKKASGFGELVVLRALAAFGNAFDKLESQSPPSPAGGDGERLHFALALLSGFEWSWHAPRTQAGHCPTCGYPVARGHEPGCSLAAVLTGKRPERLVELEKRYGDPTFGADGKDHRRHATPIAPPSPAVGLTVEDVTDEQIKAALVRVHNDSMGPSPAEMRRYRAFIDSLADGTDTEEGDDANR